MPRKIKPADTFELVCLSACLRLLKRARDESKWAKCPQTTKAIRHALKSADGAMRHMRHRLNRTQAKP